MRNQRGLSDIGLILLIIILVLVILIALGTVPR